MKALLFLGLLYTHGAAERVAWLEHLLAAVRATEPTRREHAAEYVRVLDRGQCAAATERLEVECLMAASRRYCKSGGQRCLQLMDLAISNALAEKLLLPPERRYQLTRGARDPRAEVAAELRRLAGALAVDFRLRMGGAADDATVARDIDRFCLTTADATNLPWQACASSLVWFLGTERAP